MEETKIFNQSDIKDEIVRKSLLEIVDILESRGYDPISQIVGYLVSGDPGYITSHKEARNKIVKFERNDILEAIVRYYVKR